MDLPGTRKMRDHEIRQKVEEKLVVKDPVWGHTSMSFFA